jgi:hypothetical protein
MEGVEAVLLTGPDVLKFHLETKDILGKRDQEALGIRRDAVARRVVVQDNAAIVLAAGAKARTAPVRLPPLASMACTGHTRWFLLHLRIHAGESRVHGVQVAEELKEVLAQGLHQRQVPFLHQRGDLVASNVPQHSGGVHVHVLQHGNRKMSTCGVWDGWTGALSARRLRARVQHRPGRA